MNRKKLAASFIIILLSTALTGCWSRQELNEIGLVLMMSLDKIGNHYQVGVQFVNPAEIASQRSSSRAAVTAYKADGRTILEAIRKISTKAPKKLYFAHMKMLIVGEKLAKAGLAESLDYLYRNHEIRTNFYIAISRNESAEQILEILTPVEQIPATGLFSQLENSTHLWAATGTIKMNEVLNDLTLAGREPAVTGIEMLGSAKKGNKRINVESASPFAILQFSNLSVFKNDRLIGWLTARESKGYNFTQKKNIHSTVQVLPCPVSDQSSGTGIGKERQKDKPKSKVAVEVMHSKPSLSVTMKHEIPHIKVKITARGNVSETTCKSINLEKEKTIQILEKETESNIRKQITAAIHTAQKKYKSDIFGFGQVLHRSDPKAWHAYRKNWEDQLFPNAELQVDVTFQINHVGTKGNSFLKEMK